MNENEQLAMIYEKAFLLANGKNVECRFERGRFRLSSGCSPMTRNMLLTATDRLLARAVTIEEQRCNIG